MTVVDYWVNLFTADAFDRGWHQQPEVSEVLEWWGMADRVHPRTVAEFVAELDAAGVDKVLIPSAKMRSYTREHLIWDISEDEVVAVVSQAPDRLAGLFGIDPREGMDGVRRLERAVLEHHFVGAHLHPYGFGVAVNDRRLYPFYAKCCELNVPVVMQVGHSAERMPSHLGRPILLDDIALDLPELRIVAAHTGWPWLEELTAIAWKHRNVYIGTSAHHPKYWPAALVEFANGRGRGKVMFGTDFPVLEHADAVAAVRALELKPAAERLLLGDAAADVFGL